MLNPRLDLLNDYPFARLAELLDGVTPRPNRAPVMMSVGEPQRPPPAFLHEIVARAKEGWNLYPPTIGTPALRAACAGWLARRYRLAAGRIDPDTQIAPVAGTREGLFIAAFLALEAGARAVPVALMPNPFYQVYFGAAVMAGAEAVALAATRASGFLPELGRIDRATLTRARLMYLCSPANPQGASADLAYLKDAIRLARAHDFLLVVDECYAEIYHGEAPPPGALEAAEALGGSLDNLLVFHTLSKRSSAAGLRSGFAVGAPETIRRFNRLRSYSCAATPLALMEAAAALWRDDAHVIETRAFYRANVALAERSLAGRFGFYRPDGGFFLWLEVGDGEAAAKRLWEEAAIRALPGAYVTRPDRDGVNAGAPFLRLALVHEPEVVEDALARLAYVLSPPLRVPA